MKVNELQTNTTPTNSTTLTILTTSTTPTLTPSPKFWGTVTVIVVKFHVDLDRYKDHRDLVVFPPKSDDVQIPYTILN